MVLIHNVTVSNAEVTTRNKPLIMVHNHLAVMYQLCTGKYSHDLSSDWMSVSLNEPHVRMKFRLNQIL